MLAFLGSKCLNLNPSKVEEIKKPAGMVAKPSIDGFNTRSRSENLEGLGPLTHRAYEPTISNRPS